MNKHQRLNIAGRLATRHLAVRFVVSVLAACAVVAAAASPHTAEGAEQAEGAEGAELAELAELAERESSEPPHPDEVLSVNFQDVEIRSVLQIIADFAGLNLVAGEAVAGRTTLRLTEVPWGEALDLVLATNGLGKRMTSNVLLVAPAAEIAEYERLELERLNDRAELAPLETRFIRIRYADAGALTSLLAGDGGAATLSKRGRVLVDPRTNSVILTDTAENLAAFKRMIDQLDIPVRQVQIEARIVNANTNFTEELGIRFGGGGFTTGGLPAWKFGGSLRTLSDLRNTLGDGRIGNVDDPLVDLGVDGAGRSGIAIGVTNTGYLLDLELSALAADGHAEIVARPRIITADKHPAMIESGVEIPYQQATESGATSIAFKDAVLQLEVTPQITPNERIVMDLVIKQDTVGRIYQGVPSINTTRIATQVLVDNGETVVLGGIFQTDRHQTTARTPLFGDLPLVGRLFRRTLERDDKQELFVFITPSVVQEDNEAEEAE